MSATVAVDPKRTRSLVLMVLGTVIVVATYLYLVITQPSGMDKSSTTSAGLIAIVGYLVGAVLLAAGAINRLSTTVIAMAPIAIAVNIAVGQIVSTFGIPIYLDNMGTVLVAALAGPAAGVVVGILTNVIWGLTLSPVSLPYAVVQIVIGLLAGTAARLGFFRRRWPAPLAGLVTGICCAVMSAPISAFVFGNAGGNAGTSAIAGAFQAMGSSLLGAATLQGLISDPIDKTITFSVIALALTALPIRFLQRFPFAREHKVFATQRPVKPSADAPTNPWAIVSLVLSLIGGTILAVIFGYVAQTQIDKKAQKGAGLATAGIVIGFVTLVGGLIVSAVVYAHTSA